MSRNVPNESAESESLEVVAGGIAHDFNNFLTAIQTNVQCMEAYLKVKPSRTDEMLKCLQEIDIAVEFSKKLAKRLQAHTDQCPLHVEWVRPEYLMQGLSEMLSRAAGSLHKVIFDVSEFGGFLVGNVLEMEQFMINLVQNAGEAMAPPGEILVRCLECFRGDCPDVPELRVGIPDRCCLIEIIDQGHGIRKSDLNKVFHRGFTSKEKGTSHGLGLANVRRIVEKMGGVIRVRSELNVGSTFQVFLPLVGSSNRPR